MQHLDRHQAPQAPAGDPRPLPHGEIVTYMGRRHLRVQGWLFHATPAGTPGYYDLHDQVWGIRLYSVPRGALLTVEEEDAVLAARR